MDLNQTIISLLNNMPCMTFTKDAETEAYLVCNQAFVEYAHKATPHDVIGLTDADIFDAETAAHFVEDDRTALSMDKPYVFFEDVPDAGGSHRQFQTTKLKFMDPDGRMCILGMCQDVTDFLRIQGENARIKKAYEEAHDSSLIYTHIAQALARGYTDLFYVNVETNELIEYRTDDSLGVLTEARRSADFFEGCERDAKLYIHPDDQEAFVKAMNREFLANALAESKVFELTYRRIKNGVSFYVLMRVSRVEDDRRFIVIAVYDIDELMMKRRAEEKIREERIIYARLHAITGNFLVVYVVDPENGNYREFSSSTDYEKNLAQAKEGTDFFHKVREEARVHNYPGDLTRFLSVFTRENVMAEIERNGIFSFGYRFMLNGKPIHVQMKAAIVEEDEGSRLIVGLNDVDVQVKQEEEFEKRLARAQVKANVDALTGVKNKHAYLKTEISMDSKIMTGHQPPFAIVMLDLNDLKKINDSHGHQAGDQYLRDACKIICNIFKQDTVFRVGGDEFAVLVQGNDYDRLDLLMERMNSHNVEAVRSGGIVIACGAAKFDNDNDTCVASVFERADHKMYGNKNSLKSMRRDENN